MVLQDFLSRLHGVKGTGNQYSAICPAHDDHNASLSVSTGKDGKIIMKCHAGCDIRDILNELNLTESDLFPELMQPKAVPRDKWELIARYNYTDENGCFLFQKTRWKTANGKTFTWSHQDQGGNWKKGRGGHEPVLYNLSETVRADTVYLVEGEKDVETLKASQLVATSPPDGAASDWQPQYTQALTGKTVYIIQDNDEPGKAFARKAANTLYGAAKQIKVIDLTQDWDKLPEHGDATDAYHLTPDDFKAKLEALTIVTPDFEPSAEPEDDEDLSVVCLSDVQEKQADWLVGGYIPRGQITTFAGDGGSGKTTLICSILADLSSGKCPVFLRGMAPFERISSPEKVMFFSAEDSTEHVLKAKLRRHGANMDNISYIDVADERFLKIKFDSDFLEKLIKKHCPSVVMFDPLQAFVPDRIKMSERNAMRSCMSHLIALGKKYQCTFLIILHSNKQSGVWGRKRIADSADIWDISRSVFTIGETNEPNIRYISHEKSNYGPPSDTVLFSLDNGVIEFKGYSDKKDKDFVTEAAYTSVQAPQRGEAKEFILDFLKDGEKPVKELDGMAKAQGITAHTLRRGKEELKASGEIKYRTESNGKGKGTIYYISLVDQDDLSM